MLDFNTVVLDPHIKIYVYDCDGTLVKKLGSFTLIKDDLLKAVLLVRHLERSNSYNWKVQIKTNVFEATYILGENEEIKLHE